MSLPVSPTLQVSTPGGKTIVLENKPDVITNYKRLKAAADAKHFYASLALKQIGNLASGVAGKDYVYIPDINHSRYHTLQVFHVYAPGIRVTLDVRLGHKYIIHDIQLSDGFDKANVKFEPGIYRVARKGGKWEARQAPDGLVDSKNERPVVVADACYREPKVAARKAAYFLAKTKIVGASQIEGSKASFDLHFTPGDARLGGMGKKFKANTHTDAYASSSLLAKAMSQSDKDKTIKWIGEHGGSAVLAQAMANLAQRGEKLENHMLYLSDAGTSTREIVELAHRLDMALPKDLGPSSLFNLGDELAAKKIRAGNKADEDYTKEDYRKDFWIGGIKAFVACGGSITGAAGLGLTGAALVSGVAAGSVMLAIKSMGVIGAGGAAFSAAGTAMAAHAKLKDMAAKHLGK